MNNKDNNLIYKEKYLKYKYKYVMLKGGYPISYVKYLKGKKNNSIQIPEDIKKTLHIMPFMKGKYIGIGIVIEKKSNHEVEYYTTFTCNNKSKIIRFKYIREITSGSSGTIKQYINSEENNYIVVKYGKKRTDVDNTNGLEKDLETIKIMKTHHDVCKALIVEYIVYDIGQIPCIIMENANGTIKDLQSVAKVNFNIFVNILYAVVKAIKCLFDIGLYYTDIKMGNILYRYTNTNDIQIILTDLGGAVKKDLECDMTYPPYENFIWTNEEKKRNIYATESIISWGIGILILSLLDINHDSIHYKVVNKLGITNKDTYVVDEIKKFVQNEFFSKNIDYTLLFMIIYKTLCADKERLDLNSIIKYIEQIKIYHESKLYFNSPLTKREDDKTPL